jgi:hypothetical protein
MCRRRWWWRLAMGAVVAGVCKGFLELKRAGLAERVPKVFGVQAEGAAALAHAFSRFLSGKPFLPAEEPAQTIADFHLCGEAGGGGPRRKIRGGNRRRLRDRKRPRSFGSILGFGQENRDLCGALGSRAFGGLKETPCGGPNSTRGPGGPHRHRIRSQGSFEHFAGSSRASDHSAGPSGPKRGGEGMILRFRLNGRPVEVDAPPGRRLLDLLREDLGLIGTKEGCGEGECGACTVLVDGKPRLSCLTLAIQVEGKEVLTVEGLAQSGKTPSPSGSVHRDGWCPVRVLHAWLPHGRLCPAFGKPESHEGRGAGVAFREPLPLHGLRADRGGRAAGGGEAKGEAWVRLRGVVLAAGPGRRMGLPIPKLLLPIGGKPMLERVLDLVEGASSLRPGPRGGCLCPRDLARPLFRGIFRGGGSGFPAEWEGLAGFV